MTKEEKTRLNFEIRFLKHAIIDMANGKDVRTTCNKYNLNFNTVNTILMQGLMNKPDEEDMLEHKCFESPEDFAMATYLSATTDVPEYTSAENILKVITLIIEELEDKEMKEVLRYRFIDNIVIKDISVTMGISKDTVNKYIDSLKDMLSDTWGMRRILFELEAKYNKEVKEHIRNLIKDKNDKDLINSEKIDIEKINNVNINTLGLCTRTYNSLVKANIKTIGQLLSMREQDLLNKRNISVVTTKEIKEALNNKGLHLLNEKDMSTSTINRGIDYKGYIN